MVLRNTLIDLWRAEHEKAGYVQIDTPIMLNRELWEISGHWFNYRENMYTSSIDDVDFAIKPMNCPGGVLAFKYQQHSYRDLPARVAELGKVHRHEFSGALHGLFRVRAFTQDDSHIFMTEEQIESEIIGVVNLIDKFYSKLFGFQYSIELSTRPENQSERMKFGRKRRLLWQELYIIWEENLRSMRETELSTDRNWISRLRMPLEELGNVEPFN